MSLGAILLGRAEGKDIKVNGTEANLADEGCLAWGDERAPDGYVLIPHKDRS